MSDRELFENESPDHKYFTQLLNMAEDDLDPYQYRLLAHYVRWANLKVRKTEGYKLTAKRCKMSPMMVLKARAYLIEQGYIRFQPPTAAQANKGIGGIVIIIDRWAENIARYVKPVSVPSPQVDKVEDIPGSQVDKKKESTVNKNTVRKQRAPDEIFDLVTLYAFEGSTVQSARIGKVSSWFKGSKKNAGVQPIEAPATTEQVQSFYRWFGETYPKINMVQDVAKTAGYWQKFVTQAARRDASKSQKITFE